MLNFTVLKMNRIVLLVLFCFYRSACTLSEQKKGFLVTAPSTLLSGSLERVCISLHNNTRPVRVSASVHGLQSRKMLATSFRSINSVGCLELQVPQTEDQVGRIVVRLHSAEFELSGNSEQTVTIQKDPLVMLVVTDKPTYKPGQDVCFRILSLTHTLKPHHGKISKVWIETPSGIRVHQWREIELTKHGLIQLQFSLDKEPFLGLWKIKVQNNSSKIVEKVFPVKEYTPPKFEVVFETPNEILADSKNVSWRICAKYSYGKIVLGDAHIEIKLQGSRAADQPSINNKVKLQSHSGCVDVSVSSSMLSLSDPLVHPTAIQLTATVTERGTGVSYTASTESPVRNQPFSLLFHCSDYYKPGLPYKGNLEMRTMEGQLRAGVGEKIQLCVRVRYRGHLAMKVLHCWNYTTDFSSQVVFALPEINDPLNVQFITLIATATDYLTKLYPGSAEVMMLQPTVTHNVKPWFSPSHSYLDAWTRTILACGTTHTMSIYYSVSSPNATTPLFYYLIESRGDLLMMSSTVPKEESVFQSNDVTAREVSIVRTWKLAIPVTPDMSPQSTLIVYYVRSDGEVVAASTILKVDQCFKNKVRVRWAQSQLSPRESAQLCIRASPHSICGVSVIDRQLTFNSSKTMKDLENVWDLLKRFTIQKLQRDQQQYCKNKTPLEETPPTYELRRKRSLFIPRKDFSSHVDAITAFDDVGVTLMSNLVLETRPCEKFLYPDEYNRRGGIPEDELVDRSLFIADNLMLVTQEEHTSPFPEDSVQSLVRDYFPDTWIWSLVYTGKEGEVTVNSSAPDTITSWDTNVMCISEKEGLGISRSTDVNVFMPFFVHVETPYSIKRGENVKIKVIVYNYMHHSLPVVLRFPKNDILHVSPGEDVRFCLKELSPHSHVLSAIADKVGIANLTVEALIEPMPDCGPSDLPGKSDSVIKQLLVKNDGFAQQKSYSDFICPSGDKPLQSVSWNLQLPNADNLIPGSERLQFTVMADLLGPVLENLDSLVLLPMGCGEQNLARLSPNLFVLKYMDAMGNADKQLRASALKNINKGYQRQLTFQRTDGSFSAFGDRDETGSMWLTTAVVKTLSEAQGIIEIDKDKLQDSIVWITRQQLENGCFPAIGETFHVDLEGEETEEALASSTLSALVIANLAGSGLMLPSSLRSNAEFCLASAITSTEPYMLALTTLALTRLGLKQRSLDAMQNLMRLAIVEQDLVHWGKPDVSLSHNIEITSYALLCLLEQGGYENLVTAHKAVRWISLHRNENGGFVSTQDTVVALEALTAYATALPAVNRTQLMVMLSEENLLKSFQLSDYNKLLRQQLIKTDNIPSILNVAVIGEGCAFVQGVLKYNVRQLEEDSVFNLEVTSAPVSTVDPCTMKEVRLCVRAPHPHHITNMALLTIMMVTGFAPDSDSLNKIKHPHIKKWEEEDDQIIFYLNEINTVPVCFNIILVRKFEVEDPLPAIVSVIDYYHPEITISKSYSMDCTPVIPLESLMLADEPGVQNDRFDNFHNVDFDLETPSGMEGPKPVYVCPPNSTALNCKR